MSISGGPSAVNMLRTALPSRKQTLTLDACIHGDSESLDRWLSHFGTERETLQTLGRSAERLRRLLSLLYLRIREHDIGLDKTVVTYLRVARVREQLRTEAVQQACNRVLTTVCNSGATPIVLKGVALAETAYPDPSTRHCHDLDLLLPHDAIGPAVTELLRTGFGRIESPPSASVESVWVADRSGFPIGIHASLHRVGAWNALMPGAVSRSVARNISGVAVRILSPVDALLHVCCSGLAAGSWFSPCWAADASFLIEKNGGAIDWNDLVEKARAGNQAKAAAVAFEYLKSELRAAIPAWVIDALRASSMTSVEIDSLWAALLLSVRERKLGFIRRCGNPVEGAHAAWWLLTRRQETRETVNA